VNRRDVKQPALISLPDRVRDRDVFHDKDGRVYVTLGYILMVSGSQENGGTNVSSGAEGPQHLKA